MIQDDSSEPFDFLIIEDQSNENKTKNFINSIQYLSKFNQNIPNNQLAINYLQKCKFNFNEIDLNIQKTFIETFDKLIKIETEIILTQSIQQSSNLKGLTHYLEVLSNDSYDLPSFRKIFKEKTSSFENLFNILNKILKENPKDIDRLVILIVNLIETISKSFHNYKIDWESYNTIEILIKLSNEFQKVSLRNKVLNIIKNIYDYNDDIDEPYHDFEVDNYESCDDRSQKQRIAIDFILKNDNVANLISCKYFLEAIQYIGVNARHENFESFGDETKKQRFVCFLIEFLHFNFTYVVEELKLSDGKTIPIEKQAQILKRLSYISYINNFITVHYSSISFEFNLMVVGKTEIFDFISFILQNDAVHDIVIKSKPSIQYYVYTRIIASSVAILNNIKYFYSHKFLQFSSKTLFLLIKTLNKLFNIDNRILLNIIPFVLDYDDENEDKTSRNLRDIFMNRSFENAAQLLIDMNNSPLDIFSSRTALNILSIYFPNTDEFQKLNSKLVDKFIRLSIETIKYSHLMLVEDLKNFNTDNTEEYQYVIDRIIKNAWILKKIITTIQNMADISIEFCFKFHEEADDGIKVILDFVNDDVISSIFLKNQSHSLVYFLTGQILRSFFGTLHNLSKAAYKYKEKWISLNSFKILMNLGNKNKKIDSYFQLVSFMTIGNIASEEDLNNFSASLSILEIIVNKLKDFSSVLSNGDKKVFRGIFKIDENCEKVEIMQLKGWNLFEILQGLYNFSVNDNIKSLIYETLKVKDFLKVIVYNGNEIEQEFAFKLLNQLCFDKKIALDVLSDTKFIEFMNKKVSETRKNLIKYIESILWLCKTDNDKIIQAKNQNLKHLFLSYNSENRSLCLSIKSSLERLGFKIWIDVENIHGSSIDAMAKGIESAWCVLICMTEKYKESINCRFEAEYVLQLKKPFIPIIMQKSYKPGGW
jgi:hypothetical protein